MQNHVLRKNAYVQLLCFVHQRNNQASTSVVRWNFIDMTQN